MAQGWKGVELRDPAELGYEARRPYKFSCTHPHCYWYVSCKDEADAINQQNTHPCPWWGGETKVSWTVGVTLVEQMWDKLDIEYTTLVADGFVDENRKGRARAIAECIALFMKPHFVTADEVIREAKKRYEADIAGEEYETPGLGARRYELSEPVKIPERTGRMVPGTRKAAPPKTPVVVKGLTEQEKKAVAMALDSGFTPDQLAKMYKVPVEVINAAKGTI